MWWKAESLSNQFNKNQEKKFKFTNVKNQEKIIIQKFKKKEAIILFL